MRNVIKMFAAAVLLVAGSSAYGADNVQVTVTLTIAADIQVQWCESGGTNPEGTVQTWVLNTVALNYIYDTDTGDGTNPTGGSGTPTAPVKPFIKNVGNTTVDVDITVSGSTSGWTCGAANGTNIFTMEAKVGAGSFDHLNDGFANAIDSLVYNGVSGQVYLRLETPDALTVGGGVAQTITVTCTATIEN